MARAPRDSSVVRQSGFGYRRGLEAAHRGEAKSFQILNTALDDAVAKNDRKTAALAAASLLIAGHNWGTFRRFPAYLAHAHPARDPSFPWANRDEELLALSGLLIGMLFGAHNDPFITSCTERIMRLLELDVDVNVKFAAGRAVIYYAEPRELRVLGQRVYGLLQPDVDHASLAPHRLCYWLQMWEQFALFAKDRLQADAARAMAKTVAERHNLRDILFWIARSDVERSLPSRDITQAERGLAAAEKFADSARLSQMKGLEYVKGKVAMMKQQGDRAVFHAARALQYSVEMEDTPVSQAIYMVNEAHARLLIDDFAVACGLMRQASTMVPALFVNEIRDMVLLAEAYQATIHGKPNGRTLLAAAWVPIRERQFYDTFMACPEFGAKLYALTLEHRIEVEFVCRQIETHGVAVPANAPEAWPWPIRVYAFGGFAIQRQSVALVLEGKAQRRPIDLLKILIALGGRGVTKQKLYDLLWPDAEPQAAAGALDMAISRLRKLLGHPEAIRIEDSKVGFDATQIWVDVWAFDRDVEALQTSLQLAVEPSLIENLCGRLLARYRGPFLGSEDSQAWSLAPRNRWQNRFRRSLTDAGRYLEEREEWHRAITLYERALDEDSFAEDLYRRLMRAHVALGDSAEATLVYRRCCEMLGAQFGIPPSRETDQVFQSIKRT